MSETLNPLSRLIWETRYRAPDEQNVSDTWHRVADALAAVETRDRERWTARFYAQLEGFRFIPGGRILAGAGLAREVTLFNCFVMGVIPDDMAGIFDSLKEGALTMQQGGGVGYDFSTLRPTGLHCARVGGVASGPVSFMRIWDAMCATLLSTAARRGAMMATLRCDHPDIERFVAAKQDATALTNFNLSVLVTDAFMDAVAKDADWPLLFPVDKMSDSDRNRFEGRVPRDRGDEGAAETCAVISTVRARDLWQRIVRANYDAAEPGVLFIDRINRDNNLAWRERISATNPCGEIPLPPYGACNLGSLNLTRFVVAPFTDQARIDLEALDAAAATAVRMLDNVIDLSRFPMPEQTEQARGSRRLGLGITGLADVLIMLGIRYGSTVAQSLVQDLMRRLCYTAYRASVQLAREKGPFPFYERHRYLETPFVARLPEDLRRGIVEHGIRNSHLLAIAPAGTISILAGNVSSGIEPVFSYRHRRRITQLDGSTVEYDVEDFAHRLWASRHDGAPPPASFVATSELTAADHLAMQAAVQPWVDNAISKTINVPESVGLAEFEDIYHRAYELGLKGCTTFRAGIERGAVLADAADESEPSVRCCALEREGA